MQIVAPFRGILRRNATNDKQVILTADRLHKVEVILTNIIVNESIVGKEVKYYTATHIAVVNDLDACALLAKSHMKSDGNYPPGVALVGENHRNHKLPQCNSIKYLGVDIDNVLSWNLQTDSISKKLVFIISRLSRLKSVLPSQMLMYIYTSIIQPKIDYAISIWGYTTAHNINKVQRLQNRAARILTGNFDYVNTRGIDLVNNLGLMNVIQRRDYFMLIMMFKSIHGLVPDYICDQITMQRDITVRTTRSTVNNNVHVPHILLECCKNAFALECFRKILRNAKR